MVLSSNAKVEEMGKHEPNNFSPPGEGSRNKGRGRTGRRVLARKRDMT